MAHEGLACGLDAILLCIITQLNNNRCGFNQLKLSGLSGSPQSVPSLQVSVAMPYYSIVMVSIDSLSRGAD